MKEKGQGRGTCSILGCCLGQEKTRGAPLQGTPLEEGWLLRQRGNLLPLPQEGSPVQGVPLQGSPPRGSPRNQHLRNRAHVTRRDIGGRIVPKVGKVVEPPPSTLISSLLETCNDRKTWVLVVLPLSLPLSSSPGPKRRLKSASHQLPDDSSGCIPTSVRILGLQPTGPGTTRILKSDPLNRTHRGRDSSTPLASRKKFQKLRPLPLPPKEFGFDLFQGGTMRFRLWEPP